MDLSVWGSIGHEKSSPCYDANDFRMVSSKIIAVFIMWSLMMMAMMLPSAAQ
ncbi:MAG: hypothetical protein CM1200mP30_26800 [Pseudomonadota bacterium]|nr:MAG: hypothetical protein CM1200mP30_26800 [Pseudomonadota bacterium]